jgi:hypothetical protein
MFLPNPVLLRPDSQAEDPCFEVHSGVRNNQRNPVIGNSVGQRGFQDHCYWCHQTGDPTLSVGESIPQRINTSIKCPQCQRPITLITIRKACELVGVCKKTMYCWICKGRVHTLKIASGRKMICLSSLLAPNDLDSIEES